MSLQALLFEHDDGARAWLYGRLGDDVVILPADARDGPGSVDEVSQTPDVAVVFVQFGQGGQDADTDRSEHGDGQAIRIVEALSAAYPALPVVAVGRHDTGHTVLSAMRAGARDFFVIGRDDERLATLLERVLAHKPRAAESARAASKSRGEIVTVFSGPQSPLLAFLGGHVAFVLGAATEQRQRVLLFDLSMPGGNAAIIFDGPQNYTALDVLRDAERCDETLVESAFHRLRDGVYMLALPEDFSAEQLRDERLQLARLLEIFRDLFDYVVICCDRGLGLDSIDALIQHSDHALLLSDQSVLRSRQNRAMLQTLRNRNERLERIRLVIVNYRSDVGMEPERLAELLDMPLAAALGGRPDTRMRAMNAGESMLEQAPTDQFTRGVISLTEHILGVQAPVRRRRLGFKSLFGRGRSS